MNHGIGNPPPSTPTARGALTAGIPFRYNFFVFAPGANTIV